MARGRKGTAGYTRIDEFVMAYLALEVGDRPAAMAAIRGADLAMRQRVLIAGSLPTISVSEQAIFEAVGESLATEE